MNRCVAIWQRRNRPDWTMCGREVVTLPPLVAEEFPENSRDDEGEWVNHWFDTYWLRRQALLFASQMSEDTRREAVSFRDEPDSYIRAGACFACAVNLDRAMELGHIKTREWGDGVTVRSVFRRKPSQEWWRAGIWAGPPA